MELEKRQLKGVEVSWSDPVSGCWELQYWPERGVDEVVIRNMGAALLRVSFDEAQALKAGLSRLLPRERRAAQAGQRWEEEADQRLLEAWSAGDGLVGLAETHERTEGAIAARLSRLLSCSTEQIHAEDRARKQISPQPLPD